MTSSRERNRVVFVPGRADLIDAGFVLALTGLALIGFRTTYSGWQYLVVGLVGAVLGLLIAHAANVLRQPAIVLIAMTLAAFFLLGGAVALHSAPGGSSLPSGGTLRSLAGTSVHGWKELLTTLPPVDGSGALLVLPYLLGLFAGAGGFSLARRLRSPIAPVFAPLAALVAAILLGVHEPAAKLLQGGVFGTFALAWVCVRSQRLRPAVQNGSGRATRAVTAAVLIVGAGVGAFFVGPHVPGVGGQRTVLRMYVKPPDNIGKYPSPLAEFRNYTNWRPGTLYARNLFRVTGNLPAGSTIRLATLDNYNGSVWAASNDPAQGGTKPDTFQKVGPTIGNPAPGKRYTMTVQVQDYADYWLPDAGAVQAISFGGTNAVANAKDFRYNLETGTGVVPGKLQHAQSYTLRVAALGQPALKASDAVMTGVGSSAGDFLQTSVKELAGTTGSTARQIMTLAANLKAKGRYTDGGVHFEYYLPGHSVGRLTQFANGVIPGVRYVGDDEQFAASFALMVLAQGTPARVVVGVPHLPANGQVQGRDVHAWVEVELADGSWRTIPDSSFVSDTPPDKQQRQQQEQQAGQIVPPPAQGRPHTSLDDAAQANGQAKNAPSANHDHVGAGFHVPHWVIATGEFAGLPLLAIMAGCASIVGAKAWRRRRRRGRGTPGQRLVRGWRELVDHARDLGTSVPAQLTRREQGRALAALGIMSLAKLADAHVFGPGDTDAKEAADYWRQVDDARRQMSGGVGFWRRLRASVSLASLRRERPVEAER